MNVNNKRLTTSERPTKMTQPQNNCAETHLGGGDTSAFVVPSATIARDTSAFVVPSATIARSLSSTLVASTVLRTPHKDSGHTAVITVVH